MINKLEKMYYKFNPKERFDLELAAYSRNDLNEVDRLHNSCQRKCYEIEDLAFLGRLRKLVKIAHHFHFWHERFITALDSCVISASYIQQMIDIYDDAFDLAASKIGGKASPDQEVYSEKEERQKELAETKELFEKFGKQHELDLRALYEGFRLFCNKIEINHEHSLNFIRRFLLDDIIELWSPNFVKLIPDATLVGKFKNDFLKLWRGQPYQAQ